VDNAEPEDQRHSRKFFVGGLSHTTRAQHLRDHFAAFGSILDVVVLRSPDGRSRGFGYVTFATTEAAAAALQSTHHVGGRQIDIKRAVPGTNKVFVGGLPHNCTKEELRDHFEAFGTVSDAVVMTDPVTNKSRKFGFVCFLPGQEGLESLAAALAEYSNHKIRGKWIEVKRALPPHILACNDSSSPCSSSESEKPSVASAIEPLDATPLSVLTPRTQAPPQHQKQEQMVQHSPKGDFCQPWKVQVSSGPPPMHGTVARAKDSSTAPDCEHSGLPCYSNALENDAPGCANCFSELALLPTLGGLSDSRNFDGGSGLFETSEALQQSLAQLFKQESLWNPSV